MGVGGLFLDFEPVRGVPRSRGSLTAAECREGRAATSRRRGDGVERATTRSDAIAATASSSRSIRTPSRHLLRLRLRELGLALHGVALLGLGVDGLPEAIELLLEGGDLLLRE